MNERKEPMITRSIRMKASIDNAIQDIARYEDRSISKIIQRFLENGVRGYARENPDMSDELNVHDRYEKEKLMRQWKYIDGINIDDD